MIKTNLQFYIYNYKFDDINERVVGKARCSEFWVHFGLSMEELLKSLKKIRCFIFHKDLICNLFYV